MSQDDPRFSPVIALLAVSAMWEGQLSSILRDIGITTRKFGLLGHIYAEPVDDGLVEDATAHAGAASDLHVTPKGAKILRDARSRLFELDEVLAERLPGVAASLDGIRAGIV